MPFAVLRPAFDQTLSLLLSEGTLLSKEGFMKHVGLTLATPKKSPWAIALSPNGPSSQKKKKHQKTSLSSSPLSSPPRFCENPRSNLKRISSAKSCQQSPNISSALHPWQPSAKQVHVSCVNSSRSCCVKRRFLSNRDLKSLEPHIRKNRRKGLRPQNVRPEKEGKLFGDSTTVKRRSIK